MNHTSHDRPVLITTLDVTTTFLGFGAPRGSQTLRTTLIDSQPQPQPPTSPPPCPSALCSLFGAGALTIHGICRILRFKTAFKGTGLSTCLSTSSRCRYDCWHPGVYPCYSLVMTLTCIITCNTENLCGHLHVLIWLVHLFYVVLMTWIETYATMQLVSQVQISVNLLMLCEVVLGIWLTNWFVTQASWGERHLEGFQWISLQWQQQGHESGCE